MRRPGGLLTIAACLCAAVAGGCGRGDGAPRAETTFVLELRLDEASVLGGSRERTRIGIARALAGADLPFGSLEDDEGSILVTGIPASRLVEAQEALRDMSADWTIVEAQQGGLLRISPPDDVGSLLERARERTQEVLRHRLAGLGVSAGPFEPGGQSGSFRVRVTGPQPAETVTEILAAPTTLRWCEIRFPPAVEDTAAWLAPDSEEKLLEMFGGTLPPRTLAIAQTLLGPDGAAAGTAYWPVSETPVVTGDDVVSAIARETEHGRPAIEFELSPDAATRFERVTSDNIGRRMAIVLRDHQGDRVRSAPAIRSPIGARGTIAGGMTMAEARGLAIVLASGELPGRVEVVATERD